MGNYSLFAIGKICRPQGDFSKGIFSNIFDSGATRSFVSSTFVILHSLPSPLNYDLCVTAPVGKEIVTNKISNMCPVRIGNSELLADLILLELFDFDVIWVWTVINPFCLGRLQVCEAFLASVIEVSDNDVKIENIPVVREFANVFPEDLTGLPQDSDVEFIVDLTPGTMPISKA
ncbi:uncharacterized protein LOC143859652 [Tasmannia lanceolata]|uniref:uncharacterized protein LOC143859652 n=1 Tax=Tasmannia lanceolata TaxID=3420 RepID=UPI0040630578